MREVLREAQSGVSVKALCEREGISLKTFYRWRQRFSERPTTDNSSLPPRLGERMTVDLARENLRLKQLVADLLLENETLRAELNAKA